MALRIKVVDRSEIKSSKKRSSKFRDLIDKLDQLEPGGSKAIQVSYTNDKELNSMRNVVYTYNRETGSKIRSSRNSQDNIIWFTKEK